MPALLEPGKSLVEDCGFLGGGDVVSDFSVGCCAWKGGGGSRKDSDKIGCYVHFCSILWLLRFFGVDFV